MMQNDHCLKSYFRTQPSKTNRWLNTNLKVRIKCLQTHLKTSIFLQCARGGNRTHMTFRSANFKSAAATNYATRAGFKLLIYNEKLLIASKFLQLIIFHFKL